ncbi:MAG: cation:proton antiporter [Candidatus Aenigmatarchaeota archaeon]
MSELFLPLGIIAFASLVSLLIYSKSKIPAVIVLIILGMIIGPNGISIIKEDPIIDILSEIGAILLFFLIGMEYNFSRLKKLGLGPYIMFIIELLITFVLSYSIARLLGFGVGPSLIMAIIFCNTGTAVLLRLIKEMNLEKGRENIISSIVGISFLEDLVIVFLLSTISSIAIGNNFSIEYTIFSIIKALSVVLITIFSITTFSKKILPKIYGFGEEGIYLFSFFILMLLTYLATLLGLSPAVGAFIAGSIISNIGNFKNIFKFAKNFSILFISIFFVSMGMKISPFVFVSSLTYVVIFSLAVIIGKIFSVTLGAFISGFDIRSSLFAGLSMVVIGEVSMYIALVGIKAGLLTEDFLGIVSGCVLTTFLSSYFLIKNEEKIYGFIKMILGENIERKVIPLRQLFQNYFSLKAKLVNALGEEKYRTIYYFSLLFISLALIPIIFKYMSENVVTGSVSLILLIFVSIYCFYKIADVFFSTLKKINIKITGSVFDIIFYMAIIISSIALSIIIENRLISSIILIISLLILLLFIFDLINTLRNYIIKLNYKYKIRKRMR